MPQSIYSAPQTPAPEPDAWSSAVGRATTGGKSGRVIERLMGDNDKIHRELRLSKFLYEEEQQRSESAREAVDSLRATNQNMIAIHDADKTAIARRDRKIDELKSDLEGEKARRESAERQMKEMARERDEVLKQAQIDVQSGKEIARRAASQYEVLSNSWKGLDAGYKKQTQSLKTQIKQSAEDNRHIRQRLLELEVVQGQLHSEIEKNKRAHDKVVKEYLNYKEEKEGGMAWIKKRAMANETAYDDALKEMHRVTGEMKWAMNVQRDVKGAE